MLRRELLVSRASGLRTLPLTLEGLRILVLVLLRIAPGGISGLTNPPCVCDLAAGATPLAALRELEVEGAEHAVLPAVSREPQGSGVS